MKFKDEQYYNDAVKASADQPYYRAMITFGVRWADLMEPKIEAGAKLEDIAQETSREADTEGITGNMYNGGVLLLVKSWVYGEDLRKWHNKDSGAPEATGTVNSAILTVG